MKKRLESLLHNNTNPTKLITKVTGSSPRCPLRSHSLVSIENHLFIVGIGPILNKEFKFIYQSDWSDFT